MLDINLIRTNPDKVRQALLKRLNLDGFARNEAKLYDSVAQMMRAHQLF